MSFREYLAKLLKVIPTVLKRSRFVPAADNGRTVYLDITERIEVKTAREIFLLFQLAGYRVHLRSGLNRWILSVAKTLKWHPNVTLAWANRATFKPQIALTDNFASCVKSKNVSWKTIFLHYDYAPSLELPEGHFAAPIPMHPQLYVQYHEHQRLHQYRVKKRRMKIVFAGNWNEDYDHWTISELCGKLTRYRILEYLKMKSYTRVVKSLDELQRIREAGYQNEFIVLDRSVRINQRYWLDFVSQADFFLCPPGILFPWSHNSVEAMAVGTVPFLNYPDWFFPNLIHGLNCIEFSSLDDIDNNMSTILAMGFEEIQLLRNRTIEFYSTHLAPQSFVRRLLESSARQLHLHIWREQEEHLRRVMSQQDTKGHHTTHHGPAR